jgi:hypothetical protein
MADFDPNFDPSDARPSAYAPAPSIEQAQVEELVLSLLSHYSLPEALHLVGLAHNRLVARRYGAIPRRVG